MLLKELSREDLEFVAAWSVYFGELLKLGSVGHLESGIKWQNFDCEWMALDNIFCDAKYANDPISAILMHKPLHDAYDKSCMANANNG